MVGFRPLLLTAVLLGSLMASCVSPSSDFPRPVPVTLKAGLCDTIFNTERCAQTIETHQIRQTSSAERTAHGVCFEGLKTCVPPDTTTFFGNPTLYWLGALVKPRFHVFWAQYSEGNSVLLVHRASGQRLWVDAVPVPSPSGDRVAVASADLFAQYNPNRLTVLKTEADSLVEQWSIEPQDWGPATVSWRTEGELQVHTIVMDSTDFGEIPGDTLTAREIDGRWRIMPNKR